jgi:hypothetical protein
MHVRDLQDAATRKFRQLWECVRVTCRIIQLLSSAVLIVLSLEHRLEPLYQHWLLNLFVQLHLTENNLVSLLLKTAGNQAMNLSCFLIRIERFRINCEWLMYTERRVMESLTVKRQNCSLVDRQAVGRLWYECLITACKNYCFKAIRGPSPVLSNILRLGTFI